MSGRPKRLFSVATFRAAGRMAALARRANSESRDAGGGSVDLGDDSFLGSWVQDGRFRVIPFYDQFGRPRRPFVQESTIGQREIHTEKVWSCAIEGPPCFEQDNSIPAAPVSPSIRVLPFRAFALEVDLKAFTQSRLTRLGMLPNPATLSDHLKNQRLGRSLSVVAAARIMAADPSVIRKLENEHRDPSVEVWPRILKFLGFYPYPTTGNISAQVLMLRRIEGASTTTFGRHFGSSPTTVKRWESGELQPHPRALPIIQEMLAKAKIPPLEASGQTNGT